MIPRSLFARLVVLAIVLPVAIVLLVAVGALLPALGDEGAGRFFVRAAVAVGVFWVMDVVALVAALGLHVLDDRGRGDEELREEP